MCRLVGSLLLSSSGKAHCNVFQENCLVQFSLFFPSHTETVILISFCITKEKTFFRSFHKSSVSVFIISPLSSANIKNKPILISSIPVSTIISPVLKKCQDLINSKPHTVIDLIHLGQFKQYRFRCNKRMILLYT